MIGEISEAVAEELAGGKSKAAVTQELVKQGWPVDSATEFVTSIEEAIAGYRESPDGRNQIAAGYAKHMLYGALWIIGGAVMTAWTYSAASNGGTYVVTWGAIIFGIFDFLRGLIGWIKYKT